MIPSRGQSWAQAPSILWLCISLVEEGGVHASFSRANCGSSTCLSCSHSIVWKAVTWSHLPAEEAGRCNFAMCPGRRNIFGEQLDSLCHSWRDKTMSQETRQVNSRALLRAQAPRCALGPRLFLLPVNRSVAESQD